MSGGAAGQRTKVLFVIHHLEGGGAERVMVRLLRGLDRTRFDPVLALIERRGPFLADVPADVPVRDCGRRDHGGSLRWLANLGRIFRDERADVLVSFLWFPNVVSLLVHAVAGCPGRVIVSERLTVEGAREGRFTEFARRVSLRLLYRRAARVVPNSEAARLQLLRLLGLPADRVVAIPNPVDMDWVRAAGGEGTARAEKDPLQIVAMGRLVPQKGFDLLLRAVAGLTEPWRLTILGEGREAAALRTMAERAGLSDRVSFPGFLSTPYAVLRAADVFVLSSRYEGFPNALLEAMALGLPCVATRCPTGPDELITDGIDGLLVPVEDPEGLRSAIARLGADPTLRARIGAAAAVRAREFDTPVIVRRFEALIEEVVA
ncbi:MAG: glycosyltransferase [Deferrisomatales bacterium]